MLKSVLVLIGCITGINVLALEPRCPQPMYSQPSSTLEPISWQAGAKPECADKYIEALKTENRDPSCKKMIEKMIAHGKQNVRKMTCDHGMANAYFRSRMVFGTNNHVFTDRDYNLLNVNMIKTCWVPRKTLDAQTRLRMDMENHIAFGSIRLGDRSGDNDGAGDYAVAAVSDPIEDIDLTPVKTVSYKDITKGEQEFFMLAAFSSNKETNACFSVTNCIDKGPNFPAEGDASSFYITNCSDIKGASGAPVFTLVKDSQGKCTGFALVALNEGGNSPPQNGLPFRYIEENPNAVGIGNNWSSQVGVDNKFLRDWDDLIGATKRFEESQLQQPARPAKPAGERM